MLIMYHTIQNFGGRKFWRITSNSPKFSCPKFSPLISYKHAQIGVDIVKALSVKVYW